MSHSRLALALIASLLCHALLLTQLRGEVALARRGTPALTATLISVGADTPDLVSVIAPEAPPAAAPPHPALATGVHPASQQPRLSEPTARQEPTSVMTLARQGRIVYTLLRDGRSVGRSVHEWQHDGSTYILTSRSDWSDAGSTQRVASSRGMVSAYGLLPVEFSDDVETLRFDWGSLRVKTERPAQEAVETRLITNTQDSLSLLYHLGQLLLHGRQPSVSQAGVDGIERLDFTALGEEEAQLAGSRRRLLHLKSSDRQTPALEVWFSLGAQRLPLRIRQHDQDGHELEQLAERIDWRE